VLAAGFELPATSQIKITTRIALILS